MQRATLYLLVGYPGAGKTTTSRLIHELTGAVHIWVDHERKKQFGKPTHHPHESQELYRRLNALTEQLLQQGHSVIFDTSFNYAKDRKYMRTLAEKYGADIVIIWLRTPKELAKARALSIDHARDNQYPAVMSPDQFSHISGHLEPPEEHEQPIMLDGTKITKEYIIEQLGL